VGFVLAVIHDGHGRFERVEELIEAHRIFDTQLLDTLDADPVRDHGGRAVVGC
jgi:hypothetical protein